MQPGRALYFFRDSSGHEVDVIAEVGDRLQPIEIKPGQTLNRDFFAGLERWMALAGNRAVAPALVYDGNESLERKGIRVCGWNGVRKCWKDRIGETGRKQSPVKVRASAAFLAEFQLFPPIFSVTDSLPTFGMTWEKDALPRSERRPLSSFRPPDDNFPRNRGYGPLQPCCRRSGPCPRKQLKVLEKGRRSNSSF